MSPRATFLGLARVTVIAVAVSVTAIPGVRLSAQAPPHMSLEEGLFAEYPKGTLLRVRLAGIQGTTGCKVAGTATFKDGKLAGPGFGQKLALAALKCDLSSINPASTLYLTDMKFIPKSDRLSMALALCSVPDCSNGEDGAISAQVNFDFPKGFVATADLAQLQVAITQVLWKPGTSTSIAQPAPVLPSAAPAVAVVPRVARGSLYMSSQSKADVLKLNADDSFVLRESGGSFSGKYSFAGSTLTLHIAELQKDVDIAVQGENLLVNGQDVWNLQAGTADPSNVIDAASGAAPADRAASAVGSYAKKGKPTDHIKLGADQSVVLEEDGKSSSGIYSVSGDRVMMMLGSGSSGRAENAQLVDNTLVDSRGVVWTRSVGTTKAVSQALTLDQVIDMAAAKVSDDMIVAAIKRSGSKFVLTPDQLIRLKKAGVSDEVIRALNK